MSEVNPTILAELQAIDNGDIDDFTLDRLFALADMGLLDFDEVPNYGPVFILSDAARTLLSELSTPKPAS